MSRVKGEFLKEFRKNGEFNANACINCGTCTGLCPMDLDILPRELFRNVLLGLEDKIIEKENIVFKCLLCRMCEQNCPSSVKITENVLTMRKYLNKKLYNLK